MIPFLGFGQRSQDWFLLTGGGIPTGRPVDLRSRHDSLGRRTRHPGLQLNEDHEERIPRPRRIDRVGQRPIDLRPHVGREGLVILQDTNNRADRLANHDLLTSTSADPPRCVFQKWWLITTPGSCPQRPRRGGTPGRAPAQSRAWEDVGRDINGVRDDRGTGNRNVDLPPGGHAVLTEYIA